MKDLLVNSHVNGWWSRSVALLLVVAGLGRAMADDRAATTGATSPVSAAPDNRTEPGETFTIDSLGTALEQLGYRPQRTEHAGSAYYQMTFSKGSINLVCHANIAPNQKAVWLMLYLTTVQIDDSVPSAVLQGMIDANRKGFCYFESYPGQDGSRSLWVTSYLGNSHLTRDELRNRIGELFQFAADTEELWNKEKWSSDQPPAPPTPPAPPPS